MSPLKKHPFITWFASNPVVVNILMFSILAAGIYTSLTVRKEGFPAFESESVTVEVPIRGGTPEDVERGVAIKIEEALQGDGPIARARSLSFSAKPAHAAETSPSTSNPKTSTNSKPPPRNPKPS